ncbi:transcription termination factor NusB [Desulfamplus magnetovallimortis]|uniref:Transcription antitermination protein NusB n=1 Tax=Desulfamplus magnetovallimortis TaxID=1246637 RepID=A0A1W1HA90_9BACT|nr:transcription antitermination factor NusB [Desulfamplus magnetovallimortis]SLM29288.1 transcription termination factor NusB [Desulfamplus magnetovallimortis]
MGERRNARELALQTLFYIDMDKGDPLELLTIFCEHFKEMIDEKVNESQKAFFVNLVQGVISSQEQIDALIVKSSKNWKISRMSVVDRNIMRIAVYEFLKLPDVPSRVSINEAVDIGKRYGTKGSAAFINGVLDRVRELENIED